MDAHGGDAGRAARHGRRAIVAIVALVLTFGLLPTVASADPTDSTPINLTANQVREALFVAGDVNRLGQSVVNVIEEKLLQAMYTDSPTFAPAQAEAAIKAIESAGQTAPDVTVYDATNGSVAEELGVLVSARSQIDQSLSAVTQTALNDALGDVSQAAIGGAEQSVPGENFDPNLLSEGLPPSFLPAQVLQATERLASTNLSFATARDALWQTASGEGVSESASSLLANNPALANNSAVAALLKALGTSGSEAVSSTWGTLATQYESNDGNVVTDAANAGSTLEAAVAGASASTTQTDLAQDDISLQDETSTLAAASVLNYESGTENSTATFSQELNDFGLEQIARFPILYPLIALDPSKINAQLIEQMALSGPRLIGSVVSGLFGLNTDDEIILKQLHAIQEQISTLSTQVAAGFSGVDAGLQQIDTALQSDATELETANANVDGIRQDMEQLQDQLDAVTGDMFEIAQTSRSEQLEEAVADDIGYSDRAPGNAEMSVSQFEGAAGTFYEWATAFPSDAISELPVSDWSFNPNNVFGQLSAPEDAADLGSQNPGYSNALNANIDYLVQYADDNSWGDQIGANLPNPDVWAAGADAFSQLLQENPQYVTAALLSELQQIIGVGNGLHSALQQLAAKGSSYAPISIDGNTFGTGSELLNRALANYIDQSINNSTSLLNQLQAEANSYLALHPQRSGDPTCTECELAAPPTQGSLGTPYIDLWGGPGQTPNSNLTTLVSRSDPTQTGSSSIGDPQAINACKGQTSTGVVGLTNTALFDPLPNVYANAWHLDLGSLSTCYDALWSDQSDHTFQVELFWTFGGTQALEASVTAENVLNCSGSVSSDPDLELREDWNTTADPNFENCPNMKSSGETLEPLIAGLVAHVSTLTPPAQAQFAPYPLGVKGIPVCAPPSSISADVEDCDYNAADPSTLTTQVQDELTSLQEQVYEDIAPSGGELTATNDVFNAASRVNGAVALVDDYVELAFPVALADDPTLSEEVLGSEHLTDNGSDSQIYDYVVNAAQHPPAYNPFLPSLSNDGLAFSIEQSAQNLATQLATDIGGGSRANARVAHARALDASDDASDTSSEPLVTSTLSELTVMNSLLATDLACQTPGTAGCGGGNGGKPGPGTGGKPGPGGGGKPATLELKVERSSVLDRDEARFTLACTGGTCTGSVIARTIEHIRKQSGKVIAVTAAKHPVVQKTVTVGGGDFTVKSGATATITVRLNSSGRRLLAKFLKLPIVFTIALRVNGKTSTMRSVKLTLKAPPTKHHKKR